MNYCHSFLFAIWVYMGEVRSCLITSALSTKENISKQRGRDSQRSHILSLICGVEASFHLIHCNIFGSLFLRRFMRQILSYFLIYTEFKRPCFYCKVLRHSFFLYNCFGIYYEKVPYINASKTGACVILKN